MENKSEIIYVEKANKTSMGYSIPVYLTGLGLIIGNIVVDYRVGHLNAISFKPTSDKLEEWNLSYCTVGALGSIPFDIQLFMEELYEISDKKTINQLKKVVEDYIASNHSLSVARHVFNLFKERIRKIELPATATKTIDDEVMYIDMGYQRITLSVSRSFNNTTFEFSITSRGVKSSDKWQSLIGLGFAIKPLFVQNESSHEWSFNALHDLYIVVGHCDNFFDPRSIGDTTSLSLLSNEPEDRLSEHLFTSNAIGSTIRYALGNINPLKNSTDKDKSFLANQLASIF